MESKVPNKNDENINVTLQMPALRPLPILSRGRSKWGQIKILATVTRQWELVDDWIYPDLCGWGIDVIIPKGFVFDGASIPKLLRWLITPVHVLLVPGLIHDFGYRYDYLWVRQRDGQVKKFNSHGGKSDWDNIFLQVALDINGMIVLNTLATWAVQFFGGNAWTKNRERQSRDIQPCCTKDERLPLLKGGPHMHESRAHMIQEIRGLISALATEIEELEEVVWEIQEERDDALAATDTETPSAGKLAVQVLSEAFRADEDYGKGWHSNIAVAIQDAFRHAADPANIHAVSNEAAARFMKQTFGVETRVVE